MMQSYKKIINSRHVDLILFGKVFSFKYLVVDWQMSKKQIFFCYSIRLHYLCTEKDNY